MKQILTVALVALSLGAGISAANANEYSAYPSWAQEAFQGE